MYKALDPEKIVQTAESLQTRILERFPDSGLGRVSGEVLDAGRRAADLARWLGKPHWPLRLAAGLCVVVMVLMLATAASTVPLRLSELDVSDLLQAVEAAVNDVVFLGIAVFFLVTWETRIKRGRALKALHELRSMAHVIDMHQLTKDPERLLQGYAATPSSPQRTMTGPELSRYLDYCSECLSLLAKIAALFVRDFDDSVTLSAVNDLESLTSGLSRKIWHKISLLEHIEAR